MRTWAAMLVLLSGCHWILALGPAKDAGVPGDAAPDAPAVDLVVSDAEVQPCSLLDPCCSADRWCWENPRPTGNDLLDVWGRTGDDIFAVGSLGTIFHYDGTGWVKMASGTTNNLYAIWGDEMSGEAFAVGQKGTIVHHDGTAWSVMPPVAPSGVALYGVWGSGPQDVWAVGGAGTIVHYNGTTWTKVTSGHSAQLRAVWGAGPDDVFAVGVIDPQADPRESLVLHFDGSSWSPSPGGEAISEVELNAVWGRASKEVYAVGRRWSTQTTTIYHHDGDKWQEVHDGGPGGLNAIWGTPKPGTVYAAGGSGGMMPTTLLRLDDGATSWVDDPSFLSALAHSCPTLQGLWGTDGAVVAVGRGGAVVRQGPTKSWIRQNQDYAGGVTLRAVWGTGPDDFFVVGGSTVRTSPTTTAPRSIMLRHHKGSWTQIESCTGGSFLLLGIWGTSSDNLYVVGSSGTLMRFDGSECKPVGAALSNAHWLTGVWGIGGEIYVVGGIVSGGAGTAVKSTIFKHDVSGNWDEVYGQDGEMLEDVWGADANSVFAVGYAGLGHEPDACLVVAGAGSSWKRMEPDGCKTKLLGVWGTSSTDLFAVGGWREYDEGVILHFDGIGWTLSPDSGMTKVLSDVWGTGKSDVYAVGSAGVIAHFDGAAWSPMSSGTDNELSGIWGVDSDAFAVGLHGTVLRHGGEL